MRANLARHAAARRLLVRPVAPTLALCYSTTTSAATATTRTTSLSRRRPTTRAIPTVSRQFRRTFLNGLFKDPPRQVRPPEYEPGWMEIMVWRSRMLSNLRPPPRSDMRRAWKQFMMSKRRTRMPLNSTQAIQCRRLLEYLSKPPSGKGDEESLSAAELALAREALLDVDPLERSQNHRDFAMALFEIASEIESSKGASSDVMSRSQLMQALAMYGGATEALSMLYEAWEDIESVTKKNGIIVAVASGLAREGLEEELVDLVTYAEEHGVPYGYAIQAVVTTFFAEHDRVSETQHWFNKPISEGRRQADLYRVVAAFARRNDLRDWAMRLYAELRQSEPNKRHWDALVQGLLLLGNGIDDITSIMSQMISERGPLSANINTINSLLRAAVEMEDAELARQILSLAAKMGIAVNGETSLILLKLHIVTGDLGPAQHHFLEVNRLEPWTGAHDTPLFLEYRQLANEYLLALSKEKRPDFKAISRAAKVTEDGQIGLDPETVSTVCVRFLENDQSFDVLDILSTYSFLYSEHQREVVQKGLLGFCLNPATSTSRAWGTFQILDQYFQDLSFDSRMTLMKAFFSRKRPDMATSVASKMRQHRSQAYHPTMDTYILCLEQLAQMPDPESLETVHNMMKTDTRIQLNTKLTTALMLAYTGCGRPLRALDYWKQVISSPEGPSYASLEAVFWALEQRPNGYRLAREIWEKIERMDLEIPANVYNAYIGAVANGTHDKEVKGLILNMSSFVGSNPDIMTIGIAYNAMPSPALQEDFQEWASKRYPSVWAELLKIGRRRTEFSLCQFKIKREMKA